MEKKKILVVDDADMMCKLTNKILSDKYEVIIANSGERAIELYDEEKPDMILSDLLMPEMDGFQMLEILREKENFVIPVMFMTALSGDESEEKSLTTGAVDYIRKPFKPDVLLKRVDNIMANLDQITGLKKAAENDTMTGLYNKTTTKQKIEEAVKNGQGMLLMIDLDNFKLVNDICGHEKGDQVLIHFADTLKSIMRCSDIIGRVGGDEFLAFCKNAKDEAMLISRTEYLNKDLSDFVKECLGEDTNIPLGCSIGAAICPDDGTDYTTLLIKADEALYSVKKNGKHGYALYKQHNTEAGCTNKESSSDIKMILGEREGHRGAYVLPLDSFKTLYRFLVRVENNYAYDMQFVVFTVESTGGDTNALIDKFIEVESSCLRGSDIITRFGSNQVITILLKANDDDGHVPVDRVMEKWNETAEAKDVTISSTMNKL